MSAIETPSEARAEKTPHIVITPPKGWAPIDVKELWQYRGMLWRLILRDIKARYKQSALGPAWVVIIPLTSAGIFSIIFGTFARLPSGNVPYPVFVYTGMLIWQLFARGFQQTGNCISVYGKLIGKVYFPRLIAPLSAIAAAILDLLLGLVVLTVILMIIGFTPSWRLILAPLFILLSMASALGLGIWIAALSIKVRDLRNATPFLAQFLMWLTPVAYSSEIVLGQSRLRGVWGELARTLYELNPMFVATEGFRWALFGTWTGAPTSRTILSMAILAIILTVGLLYFRRVDRTVADVM